MAKRLTTEEFIKRAKKIHENKYDYSKTIYLANKIKVCIICPAHGIFEMLSDNHIRNQQGCAKCCFEKRSIEHS